VTAAARNAREAAARTRLRELAQKFLQRSAVDLGAMRRDLIAVKAGEVAAQGRLVQLAHRMRGSGAMFGFPDVSDCAGRLEQLLVAEPAGAPLAPAKLGEVTTALESLAALLLRKGVRPV
jgi:HPt (histidine-containing phosphotransfer) domain-containing protein